MHAFNDLPLNVVTAKFRQFCVYVTSCYINTPSAHFGNQTIIGTSAPRFNKAPVIQFERSDQVRGMTIPELPEKARAIMGLLSIEFERRVLDFITTEEAVDAATLSDIAQLMRLYSKTPLFKEEGR